MRKNPDSMNVAMEVKKLFRRITKLFTKSSSNSTSREVDLEQIAAQEQKHFSYETLSRATDNFNLDRKLGEGGFGPVYKGKLDDGREIAVKKLSRTSRQGKTEFQNEAWLLTRIQHRNVVNLLGYCASGGEKLLVYEYVHHESLDKLLFNPNRRGELDWKKRFDVICGVAKGLHYLHEDAHKRIIHRDIKASNILLDQKWVPKIADFGMARLFPEDTSHVNTRVVGTNGYMAPEYLLHGDLSVKVDVFSYGVLILELVSGQRNSSFDPNLGAENLPDWAYKMHKKKSSQKIMDPILEPTAVEQEVVLCAHIGLLCTQSDPSLRPTMHRVRLLLSKEPSSLEEPTRPAGFTGSRYRRPRKPRASSSNASSSGSSFITSVGTAISKASTRDAATSLPSPFPEYRCAVSHERSLDNQEAEVEAHDVQAVEKKVQRSKAGASSQEAPEDLPKVTDEEVVREARMMEEIKDHLSILFLLPEDYEIEKDMLIQLWMAAEHVKNEPRGEECFSVVLDEGYLLHCGTNFMTGKDRYRINTEKIDELLVTQKHNASNYLRWRKEWQNNPESIQHVSLDCSTEIDATTFQTLEKFNQLRTLLFLGNHGRRVTQMPSHLFSRFNKLQALDLSRTHMKELPSSIGHMIHLRYLDLSWTLIKWLPDIVCSLDQLQTLKLTGCMNLRELPGQLYKLTKLRRLDLDVLRQLKNMPRGIGALVNLRTLSAFLVGTEDGCKIQELKELNNLSGNFCIAKLEHVDDADEAKQVALYRKEHIEKLELRWTASELSSRKHNKSDPVLECLQPCTGLEELRILCYQGSKFPCWVSNPEFSKLVSITFYRCENVSELPLLEQLPLLKYLDLIKMNSITIIERRPNLENDIAFFRLEKLEIDEMQSLKTWRWGSRNEDDFRSLVELTISGCPELRELDLLPHLSAIKRLEIRECPKLQPPSDTKLPDSLEELIVEDCPHIDPKEIRRADGRSFT